MESASKDAYEEALMLWELQGYDPTINVEGTSAASTQSDIATEDNHDEVELYEETTKTLTIYRIGKNSKMQWMRPQMRS